MKTFFLLSASAYAFFLTIRSENRIYADPLKAHVYDNITAVAVTATALGYVRKASRKNRFWYGGKKKIKKHFVVRTSSLKLNAEKKNTKHVNTSTSMYT